MCFKHKNILILDILLELNEVSLHKINYYLILIINELKLFWNGITLNNTYEYLDGKRVCVILILVLYNIPIVRKICNYILALVSYYIYIKKD